MVNAQRFRARKVDLKRTLPVYRASDLDDLDDDDNRQVDAIETGVEKDEEAEHHLQAAISATLAAASGSAPAKSVYIPTPDASQVTAEYEALYKQKFTCPRGLIRSSETVEECCAPMYCADDEDLGWLKEENARRSKAGDAELTVDAFEAAMDALETVTRDMVFTRAEDVPSPAYLVTYSVERERPLGRKTVGSLYDHWKTRRVARNAKPIMAALQNEDGAKAEIDPYVCFRRREVRQGRKTRRADQRSLEQLRRLRVNLAAAAQMLEMCVEREREKTAVVEAAQEVARQRCSVLRMRRRHNVTGSDFDDLFVPPQQTQRKRVAQAQRPRAAGVRKPRVASGLASAAANAQSNNGNGLSSGDCTPQPFMLPRTVSVAQYPAPKRLSAMADRIRSRAQSYEARMAGWVDATFAGPAAPFAGFAGAGSCKNNGLFWAPPSAASTAFRMRAGRFGRLYVDRRAVRAPSVPDARVQQYCAGLLRPEDHARLQPRSLSSSTSASDQLAELLRPFSFGSLENGAAALDPANALPGIDASSVVVPQAPLPIAVAQEHQPTREPAASDASLLSGSTVGGFSTPAGSKDAMLATQAMLAAPMLTSSASMPAVPLFSGAH
ncbi:Enhancer of polycomb-like protein 1 [Coemansia erecta]|uniref:Enhancer of polycomb-like protein n=1 Tax=Coemansia asiatica TaxID=1052880 RepID=A0A9W7XJT1_9FUNG|nr:Enhancer of polycomb-like protein 1 [Coemansia asiatica]KAJ2851496.1 Enhancer of polycomb-like protein 1 [Coemansia erecta]KAJ2884834.1 Enhancer of polycomb-like protein 1 [Coemansia asiatica]